jgi:hypothetical protein
MTTLHTCAIAISSGPTGETRSADARVNIAAAAAIKPTQWFKHLLNLKTSYSHTKFVGLTSYSSVCSEIILFL